MSFFSAAMNKKKTLLYSVGRNLRGVFSMSKPGQSFIPGYIPQK